MDKKRIAIAIGLICFLLAMGIAMQIKSVTNTGTTVARTQAENALRDSVLKWKENYDKSVTKLSYKEAELEKIRSQVVDNDDDSKKVNEELDLNNKLLGLTELNGEGVIITAKDADSSKVFGISSQYIVHDGDLVNLVNALKNAGAEAISINGERIINTTAITCSGNIVLINGEKVGSPFIISAIGNQTNLYGSMIIPDSYYDRMKKEGVNMKVEKATNVQIPKYNGTYKFKFVTPID